MATAKIKTHLVRLGKGINISIVTDGNGGGDLKSNGLREACPDCGSDCCYRTCPAQAEWQDSGREEIKETRLLFNAAVDGMESLLLALACEGVQVDGKQFKKAITTALDKIANEYGD